MQQGHKGMSNLQVKASNLIEQFMYEATSSGLAWDEAVAVFGLAAKAAACAAATHGDESEAECLAHARTVFEEAFSQDVRVSVSNPDLESGYVEDAENALLAIARCRSSLKHH
jgi:hypothetical protein